MRSFVILFLVANALVLMVFWGSKLSHKSSLTDQQRSQTSQQVLGRSLRSEKQVDATWIEYTGKYMKLSYPKSAKIFQPTDPQPAGVLESFSFDSVRPRVTFSVTVAYRESNQTVDEISGIRFRRLNSADYEEEEAEIFDYPAILFSKHPVTSEKTMFILGDKFIYSFSATSPTGDKDLEDMFERVISSVTLL